jgi:hypothetical protein
MAEFTKGVENLQEAMDTCKRVNEALAGVSADEAVAAKAAIEASLTSMDESSSKFFMKTMMSVPPTKACKTEAAAVASLVEQANWSGLPAAVAKLEKATKTLATKAKMDGTTIT